MTLRLAWFATARGTGSRGLFEGARDAIAAGRLDAELAVVFCNRERGQSANTDAFLDAVTAAGVPLVAISSGAWRKRVGGEVSLPAEAIAPWRHDFDRAVWEAIAPFSPNVGVLAGYMLIATRELCERLPLLNLHPAEPGGPVGAWQEVILALIEVGASTSGMMTQRATESLDRGPVVTSCRYPIRGGAWDALWDDRRGPASDEEPLFQAIRAAGVKREPLFLLASLQALAAGRIVMPVPDAQGPSLDLTAAVETALVAVPS